MNLGYKISFKISYCKILAFGPFRKTRKKNSENTWKCLSKNHAFGSGGIYKNLFKILKKIDVLGLWSSKKISDTLVLGGVQIKSLKNYGPFKIPEKNFQNFIFLVFGEMLKNSLPLRSLEKVLQKSRTLCLDNI